MAGQDGTIVVTLYFADYKVSILYPGIVGAVINHVKTRLVVFLHLNIEHLTLLDNADCTDPYNRGSNVNKTFCEQESIF